MNKVDELRSAISAQMETDLRNLELNVLTGYTLADAIREGSTVTKQAIGGWGSGEEACALSAAAIAAQARGYLR